MAMIGVAGSRRNHFFASSDFLLQPAGLMGQKVPCQPKRAAGESKGMQSPSKTDQVFDRLLLCWLWYLFSH